MVEMIRAFGLLDEAMMLLRRFSEGLSFGVEGDDWWCKKEGRCLVERGD